jgi:hypothetical protein
MLWGMRGIRRRPPSAKRFRPWDATCECSSQLATQYSIMQDGDGQRYSLLSFPLLSSPLLSSPLLSSSVLFCSVVLFCSLFVCFFCLLFYFIFVSRCLFLCLFLFVSFFNYILFSFSLLFSSLGLHPQLTVVPMYNNVPNTALQTRLNSEFSALRATNEWDVGRPTTMFKYLDYRKVLFKDLQPIGMMTRSVCIITNCFNILDANATSEFYDCVPPSTLGHYLV